MLRLGALFDVAKVIGVFGWAQVGAKWRVVGVAGEGAICRAGEEGRYEEHPGGWDLHDVTAAWGCTLPRWFACQEHRGPVKPFLCYLLPGLKSSERIEEEGDEDDRDGAPEDESRPWARL